MTKQLLGTKQGMTTVFDEKGNLVACTLITIEKHIAVQIKQVDGKDGYNAIQYGALKRKAKHTRKPLAGHFKKAGVEPRRKLFENLVDKDDPTKVGDEMGLEILDGAKHIDVIGLSKGKGFQGVIKRHGFRGGPAAHGSKFHRSAGSTGCRSTPGRCLPGVKKPGHMGGDKVTVQSLKVIKCDAAKGVLLVKGSIPGTKGSFVHVRQAVKKGQA